MPNNPKLTRCNVSIHDNEYEVILGRNYLYLIDYSKSLTHKVKQSITLLNLFSETLTKTKDGVELVTNIIEQSNQETKELYEKRYINNLK